MNLLIPVTNANHDNKKNTISNRYICNRLFTNKLNTMAKAQFQAQAGDHVEIIKDDENNGFTGSIESVDDSGTMLVSFPHSANEFEYSPDEVILHPTNPLF